MDKRRTLVSDSLARWHLEEEVADRFARDEEQCQATWHVIAVSREAGSGGATVARMIAQRLGFTLYDREILTAMAERLQADIRHVEAMDEAVPSAIDNILRGAIEHIPSTASYRRILGELMHEIATRGKVVILGRGSTILVPEALRVRIVAPMDIRVARVGELEGLTPSRARKLVEDIDRKRRAFYHVHFRQDADDATGYDLVINTERTSLEHTADLVLCAVERRRQAIESDNPKACHGL